MTLTESHIKSYVAEPYLSRGRKYLGPCKHIAATGFAVIQQQAGGYTAAWESEFSSEEMEELVQLLKKKTKDELIDIIMNWCENDPDLMNEL